MIISTFVAYGYFEGDASRVLTKLPEMPLVKSIKIYSDAITGCLGHPSVLVKQKQEEEGIDITLQKKSIRLIWGEERSEYNDIREAMTYLCLQPYSPDLNLIEQVWRITRREKTHNRHFGSLSKITDVLDEYFAGFPSLTSICANFTVCVLKEKKKKISDYRELSSV